jgi:hypothetical protein
MTLDTHTKQVVAVGLAYAICILERAPAHWIRPGLLFDLHSLLEKLTDTTSRTLRSRWRERTRRSC